MAGNGTECEIKTIELSSPTGGGKQCAFLNMHNFTAVMKNVPKLRKGNCYEEFSYRWEMPFQVSTKMKFFWITSLDATFTHLKYFNEVFV